jgi:hypothetical protein
LSEKINFEFLLNYKIDNRWGQEKLFIKQFIENNFISSKMSDKSNKKTSSSKIYQYDDWVCLMCQNLNYSFRKTCNVCIIQVIDAESRQNKTMTIC